MAGSRVRSPRRIAAAAAGTVLVVGTVAGLFGWGTFLGVYAGMFLLLPLAALTAWAVLKLWETGGRVRPDGPANDGSEDECADPLAMLRERYAAGDLDEAEFEHRVGTLLRTADIPRPGVGSVGESSVGSRGEQSVASRDESSVESPVDGPVVWGGGAPVADDGEAEPGSAPGRRATDD